jgi:hypothetical protein
MTLPRILFSPLCIDERTLVFEVAKTSTELKILSVAEELMPFEL